MFKYTKNGLTHSFNDGCGEPEHNQKNDWQTRFTKEFGIHFSPSELQFALEFIREEIENAYEQGRKTKGSSWREGYDRGVEEATNVCNEKTAHQKTMNIYQELEKCLAYCREQNGVDYCKNCGLEPDTVARLKEKVDGLVKKEEKKHGWDNEKGVYHCSDGEHLSWWRAIKSTPEWRKWYDFASENTLFDVGECEGCGWMSEEHAKMFMKFVADQERLAWIDGKRCHTCGKEMENDGLSDTCDDCFENN